MYDDDHWWLKMKYTSEFPCWSNKSPYSTKSCCFRLHAEQARTMASVCAKHLTFNTSPLHLLVALYACLWRQGSPNTHDQNKKRQMFHINAGQAGRSCPRRTEDMAGMEQPTEIDESSIDASRVERRGGFNPEATDVISQSINRCWIGWQLNGEWSNWS